jgi:hypothetical protein
MRARGLASPLVRNTLSCRRRDHRAGWSLAGRGSVFGYGALKVSERGRIAADVVEQFHAQGPKDGFKNGKTVAIPAFKDGSTSL